MSEDWAGQFPPNSSAKCQHLPPRGPSVQHQTPLSLSGMPRGHPDCAAWDPARQPPDAPQVTESLEPHRATPPCPSIVKDSRDPTPKYGEPVSSSCFSSTSCRLVSFLSYDNSTGASLSELQGGTSGRETIIQRAKKWKKDNSYLTSSSHSLS